ncbi:PIG-L deacetylase family protein [Kocuria rosea]|uniref:PIG-L deacetylase family protein n=1 Tax=Kocuria rosea TaxID=1275 RepID=UPI001F541721|nr:PIG-L deacetylase family protein [Kocuria rosea]
MSTVVLIYVLSKGTYLRHARGIRAMKSVRNVVVVVYTVLLVLNLWCATIMPHNFWCDVIAVSTLLATVALAAVVAERRIPATTVVERRRVLAVGAHPDDLELACGATLAKLVDTGHEVRGLVMSNGEEGGNKNMRPDEARHGATFLGLRRLDVLTFPDTKLETVTNDMVRAIEAAIREFEPDVIFTHSAHDQHQDHYAVHQATLRAARAHHSILCFESPSVTRDFDPSVFVDIDGYVDVKVEAVLAHRDQAGKPYMTPGRVRGMAAFRGAQAKNTNAEAFEPVRLLGSAIGDL